MGGRLAFSVRLRPLRNRSKIRPPSVGAWSSTAHLSGFSRGRLAMAFLEVTMGFLGAPWALLQSYLLRKRMVQKKVALSDSLHTDQIPAQCSIPNLQCVSIFGRGIPLLDSGVVREFNQNNRLGRPFTFQ